MITDEVVVRHTKNPRNRSCIKGLYCLNLAQVLPIQSSIALHRMLIWHAGSYRIKGQVLIEQHLSLRLLSLQVLKHPQRL